MEEAPIPAMSSPKDAGKNRTAKSWMDEIRLAEQDMSEWTKRAKNVEKIWLEQRPEAKKFNRQYAILWANTAVLQPAVYAKTPVPAVTRRFSDRDPVSRSVSEVMERALVTIFDHADIDTCLRATRDNFLVVARGTAWVRYVPTFETVEMPGETGEPEPMEVLADETLAYDFVHWSDFIHPKCRRWEDMPWVARRVYPDRATLAERFGKDKADAIYAKVDERKSGSDAKPEKPCVYEIWSRRDKEVIWVAKDYGDDVLDRRPPLYDLDGFYPCPRPAYGTLPTDGLCPVPDYVYYQDQAEEINELTAKIGAMEDALKLVGFYPAAAEGDISSAIETALSPNTSSRMIPVPAWSAFVQGGGSKQMIEWMPVEQVLLVLKGAVELRRQLIEDVYQITGISDIIRGQGDASETATAQQIKSQWGGIRIRDRQAEMARFARDLTRISAEIVAEKFQPETLWRICGLEFPSEADKQQAQMMMDAMTSAAQQQSMMTGQPGKPPAPPAEVKEILSKPSQEQLIDLMRDDRLRGYRIDIETDSTIVADEQAEKQARTEFVTVLGGMLQQALPVAQAVPELVPVIGEALKFLTRAYRTGRQLEDTIEQAVDSILEKAKTAVENPPPPPPDPQMEKVKADRELGESKLKIDAQDRAARLQMDQADLAGRMQMQREKAAMDAMMAQQRAQQQAVNGYGQQI